MIRRPPRSTRTDTLFPYTTLFRSPLFLAGIAIFQAPVTAPRWRDFQVQAAPVEQPHGLVGRLCVADRGCRQLVHRCPQKADIPKCAPTDAPTVGGMQRDAGNHTGTKKPAPVRVSCELGGIVGRPATGIWCRHPGSHWGTTAYKAVALPKSEEHTSELQSLMRISYAVFCLKKKNNPKTITAISH